LSGWRIYPNTAFEPSAFARGDPGRADVIEPSAVTICCDEVPHASRGVVAAQHRAVRRERGLSGGPRCARRRSLLRRSRAFCGTPDDPVIVDGQREILSVMLLSRKRPGLRLSDAVIACPDGITHRRERAAIDSRAQRFPVPERAITASEF